MDKTRRYEEANKRLRIAWISEVRHRLEALERETDEAQEHYEEAKSLGEEANAQIKHAREQIAKIRALLEELSRREGHGSA